MDFAFTSLGLPLNYRQAEVGAILTCVRAGDSCSVIGASGVAKSNLFRYLMEPAVRRHYLGDNWGNYLFVHFDGNEAAEMTEKVVSTLLAERLSKESGRSEEDLTAIHSQQSTVVDTSYNTLALAVTSILIGGSHNLVFLFDQFDAVYKNLDGQFFANLRSLRDKYKYRVSYVVLTRMPLPTLASSPEREEFEELFSANTIGLGPYSESDARLLLDRIGARYERQLDVRTSEVLVTCTGGHPGILKAAGMALIKGRINLPDNASQTLDALLGVPDVRSECDKLWNSIGIAEQDVLRSLTDGSTASHDELTQSLLESKGLIEYERGTYVVFSPLFARYVALSRAVEKASTRIRAGLIRIDAAGEVWVDEELIVPPLTKKELLLLEYLCLAPGRLRTKDEIVAVVYPTEYRSGESISDDALNALMKRLRVRLELLRNLGHKIVTVRGKGYRLDIIETR